MCSHNSLLCMVQVGNMSISRCEICDGRAIIIDELGEWRCVICSPKKWKWNKETKKYE